jgi:hypothetical protein
MSVRRKVPAKTESPIRHFDKPRQVVQDPNLTLKEKTKTLDSWEEDAQALQRAEDEGMGGGEPDKLIDVVEAKKAIGAKPLSAKAK